MIGGDKTPFRSPCEGTAGAFTGPIIKQAGGIAASVDAYGNTTQMLDHCGNTVTAKERKYVQDVCGDFICIGGACDDCPGGEDLTTNTPEPPAISANTWLKIGTLSIASLLIGGKWIQAFKAWHGRYGFDLDGNGANCSTGAKSNIKYRTMRVQASATTDDQSNPGADIRHFELDFTVTIGRLTGVAALAAFSYSETSPIPMSYLGYIELSGGTPPAPAPNPNGFWQFATGAREPFLLPAMMAMTCCHDHDTDWNYNYPGGTFVGDDQDYVSVYTASATSIHRTITNTVHNGIDTSVTIDVEITLSDPYTTDDDVFADSVLADAVALVAEWILTRDKESPPRTDKHTTVAPWVVRNENLVPVAPPGSFFMGYAGDRPDLVDDYTNPLDDGDGNHPFDPGWAPTWGKRTWFDTNGFAWRYNPPANSTEVAANGLITLLDGSVIGAPLAAGYGQPVGGNPRGVFDKDHENWERHFCDPPTAWEQAPVSRGGFTPSYLPANAQKWTNDDVAGGNGEEQGGLWPCAFINCDNMGIYLQKWAELPIKRPSINFARPYGPDKFAIDETDGFVFFVSDFTAGVVTLKKNTDFTAPTSLPFGPGDVVGSARVGGFFAIALMGADTVTLGAKVYDVPTDWDTPSKDGSACFGRLLNPNAPGMDFIDTTLEVGGRVSVTVADESPVKLTTATTQKYLSITTPENVDICDANMTVLAGNVAATRVSNTEFQVPTAYATIADAKWIIPTGTKYKLADTRSKGDYVFRTWVINTETSAVLSTSQIDACVPFSPCGPSAVFITPNIETPTVGNRHAFPLNINHGELWLGRVDFWDIDPFWQRPHQPVAVPAGLTEDPFDPGVDIIVWTMDDGTCNTNSVETGGGGENIYHLFYPLHPFVEARCTLPTIDGDVAPAPPGDITTMPAHPPQATVANIEGTVVNAINVPDPTWLTYLREKACVDGDGTFAADYEANGT